LRVVAQQVAVLFHVGTAPGCVGDDGVDAGALEGVDRLARQHDGGGFFAGVDHERAAARLAGRGDHFAAFGGKDADGCGIDLREKFTLHAAEKQADAVAFWALRGSHARNGFVGADLRHQRFHRAQVLREQIQEAAAAQQSLHAGLLIGEKGEAHHPQSIGSGERGEDQSPV